MRKIYFIVLILNSLLLSGYSQKVLVNATGVSTHVYIVEMDGTPIVDMPATPGMLWDYSSRTLGEKVRIRQDLDTGDIIEKVYELVSGNDNVLYTWSVHIKGLNASDHVYIKMNDGTPIVDMPGGSNVVWDYSTRTLNEKIRILKELDTGEYIERVYKLVPGDDNVIYMVILGFFETDRKVLENIVDEAVKKLERDDGTLNEIKSWVIKAVKDLQRMP